MMMKTSRRHAIGLAMAFATIAPAVCAFSEDLCWTGDGDVVACTPLPVACEPVGSASGACMTAAMAVYAQAGSHVHLRSIVHGDATALLAQAVGFSADDAYWIAAYDQAVDLGRYEPVNLMGQPHGGGSLATMRIDGLKRTNLPSGGVFYHFISPRDTGATTAVDGLHPDLDDAGTEGFLVHLRSWALQGSGTVRPLCANGLTAFTGSDYALGDACFARIGGAPADIDAEISALATTAISFAVETGSQLIASADGGMTAVYAESFDQALGGDPGQVANARLGIYLHALADRISHHVCTDPTVLVGPAPSPSRDFVVDMSTPDCGQGWHALRHIWEIGIDAALIAGPDRTLEATLVAEYDELATFATARGVSLPGAGDPDRRDDWVARLMPVLAIADGAQRLEAIGRLACASGFTPFPGAGQCLLGDGFEDSLR